MRVTSAPVWIVYLREKRSADQELKVAPRAEPAEQTPGHFDDQTIALPSGRGADKPLTAPIKFAVLEYPGSSAVASFIYV